MEGARPLPSSAPPPDRWDRILGDADAKLDAASFQALTWPLYGPLLRRLVLVVGNVHDAEDVAQETYLRAFGAWSRFDGRDVRAWLYTIALRLAFNQLRGRRRWLRRPAGSDATIWDDIVDPDLLAALRELKPRRRSALLLNAVDGYTQAEVARILGVPEGTVASWISRDRATLRARLRG